MTTTSEIQTRSDHWDNVGVVGFTNGEFGGTVSVEADATGVTIRVESDREFNGRDFDTTEIKTLRFTWQQFNLADTSMWR